STVEGGLCVIGFNEDLKVDVAKAAVDLADIAPLADIPIKGIAEAEVHVAGKFTNPHLEADAAIANFVLGEIPFGNVSGAHVSFEGTTVDIKNVKAQKGKSPYEMPQARLEFGGKAAFVMDGVAATQAMDLRDFLALWHFEDDPRFADLEATVA